MQQELKDVPINQIDIDENYRKTFDEKKLNELAKSIKKNGVIQPIVLRSKGKRYTLVAGERRLRAAKIADLVTIPSVVRDITDDAYSIELQLIENIQKEAVPFMEEAYGLAALRDKGVLDIKEIAERIGKSDAYVYCSIRLTVMSDEARRIAENGWINKGVAWEISKLTNKEDQTKAASDLARTNKEKLITASGAKHYIADNFGDSAKALRTKRRAAFGSESNKDYAANWKYHLVRFNTDQFEEFKDIVRGRTENAVLSEAVDVVMRKNGAARVEIGGGNRSVRSNG